MKRIIKRIQLFLLIIIATATLAVGFSPSQAYAALGQGSNKAACDAIGGGCDSTASKSVSKLLSTVLNILSWIVGFISIVMVIVGGLKYILSNGDSNGVKSAQSTIVYALVGLAVASLSQVLVRFVLNRVNV